MWLLLLFTTALAQPFSAQEEAAIAALSVRHDPPPCASLDLDDAAWVHIAEQAEAAPWVSVRAAACLTARTSPAAVSAARRWLASPEHAGLADVALTALAGRAGLGSLPPDAAADLARGALRGPHAALARRRLLTATAPALRALAAP